jgi:hypothetical protein
LAVATGGRLSGAVVGTLHSFDELVAVGASLHLIARRRAFAHRLLRRQVVPRDVAHNESAVPVSPLIMSGLGDSRRNGHCPDAL